MARLRGLVPLLVVAPTAALLCSGGATAAAPVEVLRLHVSSLADVSTPRGGYVSADADSRPDGTRVGFDVTTCRPAGGRAVCDVGLGLSGGLVVLRFTQSEGVYRAHGTVRGGTGAYAGVSGTVVIDEGPDGADVVVRLQR